MTDLARTVLHDWQSAACAGTDAVAALGLAGLPQLYAAAYDTASPSSVDSRTSCSCPTSLVGTA